VHRKIAINDMSLLVEDTTF